MKRQKYALSINGTPVQFGWQIPNTRVYTTQAVGFNMTGQHSPRQFTGRFGCTSTLNGMRNFTIDA